MKTNTKPLSEVFRCSNIVNECFAPTPDGWCQDQLASQLDRCWAVFLAFDHWQHLDYSAGELALLPTVPDRQKVAPK